MESESSLSARTTITNASTPSACSSTVWSVEGKSDAPRNLSFWFLRPRIGPSRGVERPQAQGE